MKRGPVIAAAVVAVAAGAAWYWWSDLQRAVRFAGLSMESHRVVPALGVVDGKLSPCPDKRNCWNSDDPQDKFRIAPIDDPDGRIWAQLDQVVLGMPRTKLIEQGESYKRYTQSTAFFRFVDDIEFLHRPELGQIAIRSGSRVGFSDFGVNEARIAEIRERIAALD